MATTTGNHTTDNDLLQSTKDSLAALNRQRQALEAEADAIASELNAPLASGDGPPMGIDTPLVDREGYPRADIDVYRARTLRSRLAVIRTDHKALMNDINRGLQTLAALQNASRAQDDEAELAARRQTKPKPKYDPVTNKWIVRNWDGSVAGVPQGDTRSFDNVPATASGPVPVSTSVSSNNYTGVSTVPTLSTTPTRPFARINSVAPNSPAQAAGLQENDLVLRFGSITIDSPNGFAALAQEVPRSPSIDVVVQRGGPQGDTTQTTLTLVPRAWEGRGLIGCHIVPI